MIDPYCGKLENLIDPRLNSELRLTASRCHTIVLTPRQLCDLELLLVGGFSPLRGYMCRADCESVIERSRLANGTLWPIPITLDVDTTIGSRISRGDDVALAHPTGIPLAILTVEELWVPDREWEALGVLKSTDPMHPGVAILHAQHGQCRIGGPIQGIQLPPHFAFQELRATPDQVRREIAERKWERIVGFQTRNPIHRAHKEITDRAARAVDAGLLIHPVIGQTKPGDVDQATRVRCYQHVMPFYSDNRAMLRLLPLAMRMAGPREALWHTIIRRNFGCTHFIVGRDHAGPGVDGNGRPFYGPDEARLLAMEHEEELGVRIVPFTEMVYVPGEQAYRCVDEISPGTQTLSISGTELRGRLTSRTNIPEWFSYAPVIAELQRSGRTSPHQGFTIFFTGLSGSGKTTIASMLAVHIEELTGRPVTMLDGDLVRARLSKGLGFSREDRSANVRRVGFVAAEIVRHGGIAICALIAPYECDRNAVRQDVQEYGGYVEVHMDTPLAVCEQRDTKGLYAKARRGEAHGVTGIDDPYEAPMDAEIVCTPDQSPDACVDAIITYVRNRGMLGEHDAERYNGILRSSAAA